MVIFGGRSRKRKGHKEWTQDADRDEAVWKQRQKITMR